MQGAIQVLCFTFTFTGHQGELSPSASWKNLFVPQKHSSDRRHGQYMTVCVGGVSKIQVKTVGDRKFRKCVVQSGIAVRTTENSLDLLTCRQFCSHHRQDKTVLSCPCRWCGLGIRMKRVGLRQVAEAGTVWWHSDVG